MSSIQEYEVSVKNINEKLNLIIEKNNEDIVISINYKNIVFENIIDISTSSNDTMAHTNCDNEKSMGVENIHSFIKYSLETNNTSIEFIYDKECEIISFEIEFNIKINDFEFGYNIILNGDYDDFELIEIN